MGIIIESGSGNGKSAGVTSDNRLETASVTESVLKDRSHEGAAFGVSTPQLTVTTTLGAMLYIKNTNTAGLRLHINDIYIGWNGGTASSNKALYGTLNFGDAAPSANNTTGTAGNLNQQSGTTANMDVEYWDEVGTGMTITGGTDALYGIFGQGFTRFPIDGSVILGQNDTLSIYLDGEEAGEATINLLAYYEAIK